jgi:hypothetical protein
VLGVSLIIRESLPYLARLSLRLCGCWVELLRQFLRFEHKSNPTSGAQILRGSSGLKEQNLREPGSTRVELGQNPLGT